MSTPLPWDLVADAYREQVVPIFERFADRALDLARVPPGGRVIDVACGPGTLTARAAARGFGVEAVDFSPEMVHQARGRCPGVSFRVADGQALPFEDMAFDSGFSMFGLIFFPDRAAGLRELRRVVRPGGAVVVSSWTPLEQVPALAAVFAALAELTPGPTGELPTSPPPPAALSDEATIRLEFAAAGFTSVDVVLHDAAFEAPDAGAFWDGMERTLAPLALMRHRLGHEWAPVGARLRDAVRARLGPGPVEARMPAWITRAT